VKKLYLSNGLTINYIIMRKFYFLWCFFAAFPLLVNAQNYTSQELAEIQAHNFWASMEQPNFDTPSFGGFEYGDEDVNENFIPTAGATETFSPGVGDFFYDPGGPGGSSTGGDAGNYPNCGCDTFTTLAGVSEIKFNFFSVFGNFDYLQIYDGTDATGTLLYNNGAGGANDGDITLSDMIASHGSDSFTAASGNFYFIFHASTVVDYGGWEVEVMATGGTGGDENELLIIDLTTENQVTITATSGVSAGTVSGSTTTGFYFEDVFASAGTQEIGTTTYVGTPTLTAASVPTDNTPNLFRSVNTDPGLNIWSYSATTPTTFTTGEQAFTGDATWDISPELYNALLTAPASGNVYFPADDVSDLATATLLGTYSVILPGGPPPTGEDCDQGDDSNAFENGHQIGSGTDYENADDFYVSAENTLNVQTIEINAIAMLGPVDSIGFTFYEDDGGAPGSTVVATVPQTVPYDQVLIGSAFGYDVYAIYVDVDLNFEGGTSGASYWMQPTAVAPGGEIGAVFWEVTSIGTLGALSHTRTAGGPWVADPDGYNAVFKLHCEHVDPPTPPCTFSIAVNVEPITHVVLSDIDNTTDATLNGTPALEDFTAIEGHVTAGESYDVALEGNTDGDWVDYFTVFIDWNQNGDLTDAGEMYEIGAIANSTGTDGQQATGSIMVPSDAIEGATLMRVIKNWDVSPTNPCGTYNYGQAEDYTLVVGDGPIGPEACSQSTPSNNFENGHGNLHLLVVANDFSVDADRLFTAEQLKFNVILPAGGTVDAVDVYFYEDTNGSGPGTQTDYQEFLIPSDVTFLGNLSSFDVSQVTVDLTPTEFEGGSAGATYWVGIMIYTDSANSYWEGTSILNTANEGYLLLDSGWAPISTTFGSAAFDGVFEISGQCEQLGVSDMSSFDFAYYPNPVKDVLNISSDKAVENVSVYNMAGQSVLNSAKVTNGQIDVSALPAGVYVFRATLQGGQVETFKIVKK